MGSQNNKKIPLEVHIDALLFETSKGFQETLGLKWEWDHYCKLESIISKIKEKEAARDSADLISSSLNAIKISSNGDSSNGAEIPGNKKKDKQKVKPVVIEMDPESKRRYQHFPQFFEWLRSHGVNTDNIRVEYKGPGAGFGLITNKPLKAGDVVFTIPQKAILTSSVAWESKLKILAEKDQLLCGMQNVLLAIFLIYERYHNPNSEWKAYINILPQTFDTVVYFTKEEMAILKNSPSAFREAIRMLRNVARQYAYFHSKFRKATDSASRAMRPIFTYNRYLWGVSAVTTRINNIPNPNGEPFLSLIPYWDLANHEDCETLCTDYNEEHQDLICYAGHDYDENSDFTIFYGRRSSVDFLVHNGFVPMSYRHDFYCLELGIGLNDINYNRKKAILTKIGMECQNTFPVKPDRMNTANKLFAFIRLFLADSDMLTEWEKRLDNLIFLAEATEACWKFLATRFYLLKKASENSLAATMKTLYSDNESSINPNLSRVPLILLQLLKNEQKVLEMLTHYAECQLKIFADKPITDQTEEATIPVAESQ